MRCMGGDRLLSTHELRTGSVVAEGAMFFVLLALFATLGWLTAGLLALTSASDVEGGSSTSEATKTASLAVISSIIVIAIFWSIGFHHYDIHPKILAWTAYLFDWHHVATAIVRSRFLPTEKPTTSSRFRPRREGTPETACKKRRSPILQAGVVAIALALIVFTLVPIGGGHVVEFEGGGVRFKIAIAAPATNTAI